MGYRILAVDDDTDIQKLIALVLESEKVDGTPAYRVDVVPTGQDALSRLQAESYHLVILDINLPPGLDGWDLCRTMKTDARTRDIPIIFLSVRAQPLDRMIGVDVLHADGYLDKVAFAEDPQRLIRTVKQLLRRQLPA